MGNKIESYNDLKKEVFNYVKPRLEEILENVLLTLHNQYTRIINEWYNNFDPKEYERTYNTYYASPLRDTAHQLENYYKITMNNDQIVGIAWLTISSKTMYQNTYKDPVGYVFHNTWVRGVHGNEWLNKRIKHPMDPPKTIMYRWFKDFKRDGVNKILKKQGYIK